VLKEWAGHSSLDVTDKYYLQVSESEYKRAVERSFLQNFAQLFAQFDQNKDIDNEKVNRIDLLKKNIRKYMRA
jgi:hypothetical protein